MRLHLHLISDSTGETLNSIAKAGLGQFEGVEALKHFWPMVRAAGHLERVLDEVERRPGLVLYTLVGGPLRDRLEERCRQMGIAAVPALDPVIAGLSHALGQTAIKRPGRQHLMDAAYFARVAAIDFTMQHDDGAHPEDWDEADIVLAGVSRSSKTPTSIYLANRGYKTANIPIVPRAAAAAQPVHARAAAGRRLDHAPGPADRDPSQSPACGRADGGHRICERGCGRRRSRARAADVRGQWLAGDRRHAPFDRGNLGRDHQSSARPRATSARLPRPRPREPDPCLHERQQARDAACRRACRTTRSRRSR